MSLSPLSSPRPAVFLLDGIWGGHRRWERLRRRLDREVGPTRIWSYDNSGFVSLEKPAAGLVEELRRCDRPFHLVGYSMGGLVLREAMRQAPDLPLRRAVFLHSPHEGSWLARLLPLAACREMRPRSVFLQRLAGCDWSTPSLVTWTRADLIIVPGRSARWAGATESVHSWVPAHAWPVFSTGLHRCVAEFLIADTRS